VEDKVGMVVVPTCGRNSGLPSVVGSYDVTAQHFIIAHGQGQPNAAITLVENWEAELKKK
jgi:hypothetical protein